MEKKIKLIMKSVLILFLVCYSFCFAQIPPGYYDSANGLTGIPLKSALHNIIKDHTVKSYSSLLNYYQTTDKKPNGKVWDMYSDIPGGIPPYEFNFSMSCGSYSSESDCYNREHSFPQSWFNSASPMQSDLFQVYPTDGFVNGKRSNYPYGEVSSPTWTSQNGSKLGYSSYPGFTGTVFEPVDEYKGDLARTYFYMAVRYYTEDADWPGSPMVIGAEPKPWALEMLKEWNAKDSVSQKEINRNNTVYGIQNNRNPFIDHPEYVDSIWGPVSTSIPQELTSLEIITVSSNPGNGIFDITLTLLPHSLIEVKIYNSSGQVIDSGIWHITENHFKTTIDISSEPGGIYFLQISDNKKIVSKKIMHAGDN